MMMYGYCQLERMVKIVELLNKKKRVHVSRIFQ
ncbi:hypothetical protein M2451_002629 [Dysgonomonas sp. PFB1-18]|nr:hypothetical protein [Dysgonomonas sp. PF1-14]MDH6339649.1 hypothetical protein [Dysgonomonas sp. PF1-16]MDH6381300.1 hypothetical protein [Dysgonomonas sp. PFB1-18]MDH6398512.1 hypothetical protein [Dysgonomonas sp. PF1-23]